MDENNNNNNNNNNKNHDKEKNTKDEVVVANETIDASTTDSNSSSSHEKSSSFVYDNIKYFVPFFKNEEYWIKPKYFQPEQQPKNNHDTNGTKKTLLDMVSNMFPRKMLGMEDDDGENKNCSRSQLYWKNIIEVEKRVSLILIFNDQIYKQYGFPKPSLSRQTNYGKHKNDNNDNDKPKDDGFVMVDKADIILPHDLYSLFLPQDVFLTMKNNGRMMEDYDNDIMKNLTKNMRLKLRISSQHIHPRSIVIPYEPNIIYQDKDLVAIHKPFGIPSVSDIHHLGGGKEWNSILLWARQTITTPITNDKKKGKKNYKKIKYGESSQHCDLINRLDVDVSGVILLGLSGTYRKKRGFHQQQQKNHHERKTSQPLPTSHSTTEECNDTTTHNQCCKVYLAIVPKQLKAKRITTPRLIFDPYQSKATIRTTADENDEEKSRKCRTCLYPLLQLNDDQHTLVAICLEESGQRHQIRFHLSLIHATIPNDDLYTTTSYDDDPSLLSGSNKPNKGRIRRRTGVSTGYSTTSTPVLPSPQKHTTLQPTSSNQQQQQNTHDKVGEQEDLVLVETISQNECETFLQTYVYNINGVIGFEQKPEERTVNHNDKHNRTLLIEKNNTNPTTTQQWLQQKLIQRPLYPRWESQFEQCLQDHFFSTNHGKQYRKNNWNCGKCKALQTPTIQPNSDNYHPNDDNDNSSNHIKNSIESNGAVILKHGIYLHSWRYFQPTDQHSLLEADLPPSPWWPVKIIRHNTISLK